jgi:hypothetical protein
MRALYYPDAEPSLAWLRTFALFYDCVGSVVPEDWQGELSPDISEFAARFPGAYEAMPPHHDGRYLYKLSADLLAPALDLLRATAPKELVATIGPGGTTSFQGYVFLHRDKLPPDVMHLLSKRKLLILPGFDDRYMVVEERTSNLILAHIATDIGERTGWSTATDRDVEFYFASLGRLRLERENERAQDRLASAIIRSQVPKDILGLSWSRYREVRDAYADIRKPLEELFAKLTRQSRLGGITDPAAFRDALVDVCRDFNNEVEKFAKTRFWRGVESVAPVALVSMMSVAGALAGVLAPQQTIWRLGLPIGSAAFQLYRAAVNSASVPSADRAVYQMMADMKRDVLKPKRLASLF